MKKPKFKFFKVLLAAMFLVLGGVGLAGCGGKHLEIEEDIAEQLFATESYFVENVYNQEANRDFDLAEGDHYIENSNYYVLITSKLAEDVPQLKLGHVTYGKGEQVETRVSVLNTVKRQAYRVDEGNLYVSSLLMFFNTGNDGILTISFPESKIKDVMIEVYENENQLNITPRSMAIDTLSALDAPGLKFAFRIDHPNGKVFIEMKEGDQVLAEGTGVLFEVVANPSKNNQSSAYKYETAQAAGEDPENEELEGMGVVITPGSNAGNEYAPGQPANHTLIYNFYVPTVGARTVIIEFTNTMT